MKFIDSFVDVTKKARKLPTSEYKITGKHPIIDQGQKQIAGYTDIEEGLFTDVPAIIFGDHTRVIKYIDTPFFIGADGVKVIKCLDKQANYNYLYYLLSSVRIPNTGYNRHYKWLKEAHLVEHTKEEQEIIVVVLSTIDNILDLYSVQLNKLDELIKSRFVEMFGDPNHTNWKHFALGDCLVSIENGKSYVCDSISRTGNNPAILKLSAVTYGRYDPDENKSMLDRDLFDCKLEVKDKDLLFTRKNTPELVGMSAYVFTTPKNLMMPDLIFRLNTMDSCNGIYLWQLINHELFRNNIRCIASGTAKSMSNISKERLYKLIIPLPPLELQNRFAVFVTQVEKQKATLQQSINKLEALKKSLMQDYFG